MLDTSVPEGTAAVALPATRGPDSENFPVASLFLAPAVRAQVLAFYRIVRTADDIADSPDLTPEEKLRRLDVVDAGIPDDMPEARAMLTAFRRDSVNQRCADWAALEDYCRYSAEPVGRFLLRAHGEAQGHAEADALCTALQILNHVQDMGVDRDEIGRIYIPESWMTEAGGEGAVFTDPAARRPLLDAMLDRTEALLERAARLPRVLSSTRLALQSAVTLGCAWRLLARLRAADPMAGRVALTKTEFAAALLESPRRGLSDDAVVRARVTRAGSSFARGMAVLKGDRRRALYAVYAFCRAVDDIADGAMPVAEKRRFLAAWRAKLDAPDCALSRELAIAADRFALPREELEAMIAGMETDSTPRVRIADDGGLDLYCRRVAGSVGALAVRIFGAPEAHEFGLALGRTFQLVNVLRDLDEDAERDRVYVPLSLLGEDAPAADLLRRPALATACTTLLRRAEDGFAEADRTLATLDRRNCARPS
ncbi:squalene/phytoene synthase family protein [Roseomonas sp. CCTCC AB2023176]|uniref:squalene/phytoene synthase family protein n=1 Tax=Roseomonas sp. CCTCC AB2023176 TaxID=3342640 RepID=UPI0035D5410E